MNRLAFGMSVVCAALSAIAIAAGQEPAKRVLFIGNSLTAANDLPRMVEALAAQAGMRGRITCDAITANNYSLEDHWAAGEARRAIQRGRWSVVVLQQGPSTLPESRVLLREYAAKFASEARAQGAQVSLYMVWPSRARSGDFAAVSESYRLAADDVRGGLVPVGDGWRAAWRRDSALPLYDADGFHPSPAGTYLAALMFFQYLAARPPAGLPAPALSTDKSLRNLRLDGRQLTILQQAAVEAR